MKTLLHPAAVRCQAILEATMPPPMRTMSAVVMKMLLASSLIPNNRIALQSWMQDQSALQAEVQLGFCGDLYLFAAGEELREKTASCAGARADCCTAASAENGAHQRSDRSAASKHFRRALVCTHAFFIALFQFRTVNTVDGALNCDGVEVEHQIGRSNGAARGRKNQKPRWGSRRNRDCACGVEHVVGHLRRKCCARRSVI